MAPVTGIIKDELGKRDSRAWQAFSPVYREGADGEVITPRPQPVQVVGGVFTADLEPGVCVLVNPDGKQWTVTIPVEGGNLWDIIDDAVAFPPDTAAEALAAAVTGYLGDNPVVTMLVEGLTDAGTPGKNALLAETQAEARTAIGAGTSNLTIGTTGSTAKAGNWVPAADDISDASDSGKTVVTGTPAEARDAIEAADVADVEAISTLVKTGDPYWDAAFAPPAVGDTPTVTVATSSQIVGGTAIVPTNSFEDVNFRYDGTDTVTTVTGGVRAGTAPSIIIPEWVTDAANYEVLFKGTIASSTNGAYRILVDGKMCTIPMNRVATTVDGWNYFRLVFPSQKVRSIRFEQNGHHDFGGVIISGSYTVFQRPQRDVRFRFVNIADSLGAGSSLYYYLRYESFARLLAHAMGADSFVDLSFGGTGFSDAIPDNTFADRVPQALALKPHMIGFFGSRNDYSYEATVPSGVSAALAQVTDVPVVVVSGPQQAGYSALNELVRQGVVAAGRKWINLDGVAANPSSNPTGHPTFNEHIALAKAAYGQLDRPRLDSTLDAHNAARIAPAIVVSTSPTPTATTAQTVTITATLSQAIPGKVTFYAGTTALSTVTVSTTTPSMTTDALEIGAYSIKARFVPTDTVNYKPITSSPVALTITSTAGFVDNFDRADGAIGTSTSGKVWTTTNTGFVVQSSMAGNPTAASTRYAYLDAETPNGVYTATMKGTFSVNAGLMLRVQNVSNYIRLDWTGGSNNPKILAVVAGVAGTTFTGTGGAWADGDVIVVTLSGTTISATKNGASIISGTVTELASATGFGINATAASTAVFFDSLSFVAA